MSEQLSDICLEGRKIVVTGASRGLGAILARGFHRAGADLLLVARPSTELKAIAAELTASRVGGQIVESVGVDVSSQEAPVRLFSGAWASPDVLVNNAAVQGPIGRLWEVDIEEWRRAVDMDLTAPVALASAVIPSMIRKGGGVIINLSGGGATSSRPGFTAYAAAKTALVRVTECLAAETAPFGIVVTAVAPGAMPTAMLEQVLEAGERRAGAQEYAVAKKTMEKGSGAMTRTLALCVYLAKKPRPLLSGKLIAAQWDPWDALEPHVVDLSGDIYTLRRIVPKDRGKTWGND